MPACLVEESVFVKCVCTTVENCFLLCMSMCVCVCACVRVQERLPYTLCELGALLPLHFPYVDEGALFLVISGHRCVVGMTTMVVPRSQLQFQSVTHWSGSL